jgi:hypothetical protein
MLDVVLPHREITQYLSGSLDMLAYVEKSTGSALTQIFLACFVSRN